MDLFCGANIYGPLLKNVIAVFSCIIVFNWPNLKKYGIRCNLLKFRASRLNCHFGPELVEGFKSPALIMLFSIIILVRIPLSNNMALKWGPKKDF